MFPRFNLENFHSICDVLSEQDRDLQGIIVDYGYPPMWNRPNTFESLVHIILEQQVSLASALASLTKLRERLTEIHPEAFLTLTDEELKSCYFSRQKTRYVRVLAEALVNGQLNLNALEQLSNDELRSQLLQLKGIGHWTIDIYLMFVLQRLDIFPVGDLAAVHALKQVKNLPANASREMLLQISEGWKPYRSVATMLLWHYYLSKRSELKRRLTKS